MSGETDGAVHWGTGDLAQAFTIESENAIRGRIIRLGPALDEIFRHHTYPEVVSVLVAEAVVLVTMLGSGMKFKGRVTLQSRGDGPISMIVADYMSSGEVRGYAGYDEARVAALPIGISLQDMLGKGSLTVTVDQGPDTELYQGIVGFEGTTLADCVEAYMHRSEQVESCLKVAVAHAEEGSSDGQWRAGGLMLQNLPRSGAPFLDDDGEPFNRSADDPWNRTQMLMKTVEDMELTDPALVPTRLLYRLFHQEGVRAAEPQLLGFGCTCSAEKVITILVQYSEDEHKEMLEDGKIRVRCEFCSRDYHFSLEDLKPN